MNDLILHIGITKTGTSSLQTFFTLNEERLSALGFAYPVFTKQTLTSKDHNGTFLLQYCREVPGDDSPLRRACDTEENLAALRSALLNHDHVLLSEENFFKILPHIASDDLKVRQEHMYRRLSDILRGLGVQHVTFIVYLRPQWDHYVSDWKHLVKIGHTKMTLQEYCQTGYFPFIHEYSSLLDSIENNTAIPHDIVVRRFDRHRFAGGDIYRDFCHAAGIPWDEGFVLPEKEKNPSITYDIAEALRPFTHAAPIGTKLRMETVFSLANELSARYPDPPGSTPLSPEEIEAINRRFEAGNRAISEKYFGGEPLFFDVPGDFIRPDPGRIKMFRKRFAEVCPLYRQKKPRIVRAILRRLKPR